MSSTSLSNRKLFHGEVAQKCAIAKRTLTFTMGSRWRGRPTDSMTDAARVEGALTQGSIRCRSSLERHLMELRRWHSGLGASALIPLHWRQGDRKGSSRCYSAGKSPPRAGRRQIASTTAALAGSAAPVHVGEHAVVNRCRRGCPRAAPYRIHREVRRGNQRASFGCNSEAPSTVRHSRIC
jgi:hypothetical protein